MNLEQIKSPEKFILKKVLPEDWEKFKEIRLYGLQTDPQAFGKSFENESNETDSYWKEMVSGSERSFYVVEGGLKFIGIAGLKKMTRDNWQIVAVYVLPEFRGQNLSKRLIEQVIHEAKINNAIKVSLIVNTKQESAVNLYKKIGFEIINTKRDQIMGDGKTYDEYYMEKSLEPKT
jgi:ribosomal protein S18 acetylase RimI-like enzyme